MQRVRLKAFRLENKQLKVEFGMGELQFHNSTSKLMAGLWLLFGIPKRTLRPSFVSTVVARPERISFQNAYVFFSLWKTKLRLKKETW